MSATSALSTKELLLAIYDKQIETEGTLSGLTTDMVTVKKQVKYTNGKVASLMEDKIRRDERDKVLAETKAAPLAQAITTKEGNVIVTPPASYWTAKEKLYGALAILATVISGVIGIIYGVSK